MRFCPIALVLVSFAAPALAQSKVTGEVAGVVFVDLNGDGDRGPSEPGLPGVVVCSRADCAETDSDGAYEVPVEAGYWVVWVSQPEGFRAPTGFWRRLPADPFEWLVDFPLERAPTPSELVFLHASDTHLDEQSLARFRRLREIAESKRVAFVLLTGDLVRDALRVTEEVAAARYELLREELRGFPMPVWLVPGNHENFGIERHLSGVSTDHPLYGKGMYRRYLGPNYYSFNQGGVHFVGLDTVDIADRWYYGHVDAAQLAWLEKDLARVPQSTPVVTFDHIPLFSALVQAWGYYPQEGEGPGSVLTVNGTEQYRHVVSNYREVLDRIAGRPYPLALGGHVHAREEIILGDRRLDTGFHQAAAVVGDTGSREGLELVSGVTLYRFVDGALQSWEFLPLDEGWEAGGNR